MARQGHMIETVAINQLEARRERLVAQQTQARYGVADSYDRAAQAQATRAADVQSGVAACRRRDMMRAHRAARRRAQRSSLPAPARRTKDTLAKLHNVRPTCRR